MWAFIAGWLLVLGFGSAYYGQRRWGSGAGASLGIGSMVFILPLANVLGVLR